MINCRQWRRSYQLNALSSYQFIIRQTCWKKKNSTYLFSISINLILTYSITIVTLLLFFTYFIIITFTVSSFVRSTRWPPVSGTHALHGFRFTVISSRPRRSFGANSALCLLPSDAVHSRLSKNNIVWRVVSGKQNCVLW